MAKDNWSRIHYERMVIMKKEKNEGRKPGRIIKTVSLIIGMLIAAFGGYWGGMQAKVEKLEQKLQEEYIEKSYTLLEEQYGIFTLLKEGKVEYCIEKISHDNGEWLDFGDDALDKLVLADVPYLPTLQSQMRSMDDKKILKYVDNLKEIVEKYPYSNDINHSVIYRLEKIEKELREKIQETETFEIIDDLKKLCKDNIALWTE